MQHCYTVNSKEILPVLLQPMSVTNWSKKCTRSRSVHRRCLNFLLIRRAMKDLITILSYASLRVFGKSEQVAKSAEESPRIFRLHGLRKEGSEWAAWSCPFFVSIFHFCFFVFFSFCIAFILTAIEEQTSKLLVQLVTFLTKRSFNPLIYVISL